MLLELKDSISVDKPVQLLGFRLERSGESYRYRELELSGGRLWLSELGLGLGIWQGSYKQVSGLWLRFYDAAGDWIPTPVEIAERERQEKERERLEKERVQQQADRERQEKELERLEKERAQQQAELFRQLPIEHGIELPDGD